MLENMKNRYVDCTFFFLLLMMHLSCLYYASDNDRDQGPSVFEFLLFDMLMHNGSISGLLSIISLYEEERRKLND